MFGLTSFYFLLASALVSAAPVPRATLDAATLIKNGQTAQNLNAQFQNLTATDACKTGQQACIKGDLATCVDDKWQTQGCLNGLSCFAIPFVNQTGVSVTCTSEKNALSTIHATGASNDIAVANADGSDTEDSGDNKGDSGDDTCETEDGDDKDDDGDDTCESEEGSSSSGAAASTSTRASNGATTTVTAGGESTVTVTVTPSAAAATTVFVTAPPFSISGTITLQPETTVVSGAEAQSILSSLAAAGATPVTTIINGPSASDAAPTIVAGDNAGASASASSSSSSSSSPSNTPSIIELNDPAPTLSAANNGAAAASTKPVLTLLPAPAANSPVPASAPVASSPAAAANPFPFSDY